MLVAGRVRDNNRFSTHMKPPLVRYPLGATTVCTVHPGGVSEFNLEHTAALSLSPFAMPCYSTALVLLGGKHLKGDGVQPHRLPAGDRLHAGHAHGTSVRHLPTDYSLLQRRLRKVNDRL